MDASDLTPGALAQIACILEVTTAKPGNVHPGRAFDDTTHVDFLVAAAAAAAAFDRAPGRALGDTVLDAVRASRLATGKNVNLGIVLLLTPLAAAPADRDLRDGVRDVLAATTAADCAGVYRAIRLAAPGGLGTVEESDVFGTPPDDLRGAMRLAADRDLVARQYATDFEDLFAFALPELERALDAGRTRDESIVGLHLELMKRFPDSLIGRKCGRKLAEESARRAAAVLDAGWPTHPAGQRELAALDEWLRADGHRRNPGTTADMVAATLYAGLRSGAIDIAGP